MPTPMLVWDVAFGNGLFVAVGETDNFIYSNDLGRTWIKNKLDMDYKLMSIAFGNDVFVATPGNGSTSLVIQG